MASSSSSFSSETNYPCLSELDVLKFVPHPLSVTPNNYVQWSQQMHNLIESQALVGFIDGTVQENEDYISWKSSDELLQKWIRTTLTEDILEEVKLQKTARELWTYLETIFELLNYVKKSLSVSENNYYSEWRQQMYKFIESKGYVGHIDRSSENPLHTRVTTTTTTTVVPDAIVAKEIEENEKCLSWKKRDTHVRGWIRVTLTKDIRQQMGALNARGMWTKLEKMFGHYVQLHKAVIKGDWESANEFIKQDKITIRAGINEYSETMLIVAVKSKQSNNFVEQLMKQMSSKDLALGDVNKRTALHRAAGVGNLDAAKLLVEKNPYLPNAQTANRRIPLYFAAAHGNREMVLYLLSVTVDEAKPKRPNHLSRFLSRFIFGANCSLICSQNQRLIEDNGMRKGERGVEWNPTPFKGELGFRILHQLIVSGFYDIALVMLKDKPELACFIPKKEEHLEYHSLMAISQKPSSFRSGTSFNFFENFIYWC